MSLTAERIAYFGGGRIIAGAPDRVATSWGFDSRALAPGACFVALRGERDGNDFVPAAIAAGAVVVLVDRPVSADLPDLATVVLVDHALDSLQAVATAVRAERHDLRVVGVTGSTGKTSTKDLLAAALASIPAYSNAESYNNEFGLPITLLNAPSAVSVIVTEMGERFPNDVASLCAIARPEIGIITNVGLAHAEHLGGPDGVESALGELLDALPADGLAVLDADDAATPRLVRRSRAKVLTVGAGPDADERITDVGLDAQLRPSFTWRGERFTVPLRGRHQVTNAAMAVAVAHHAFGVPLVEIRNDLASAMAQRWRMDLFDAPGDVVVLNDAYNANPASMAAALQALAHLDVKGRRIAVLGDMRELGAHSDDAHATVGHLAAALGIDVVIGVGADGARIAAAAAVDERADVHVVGDVVAARELVEGLVRTGDAVLVKASRALGLQAVAEALLARKVAR